LKEHLMPDEIGALVTRANKLVKLEYLPFPPNDRRAYPFPPV